MIGSVTYANWLQLIDVYPATVFGCICERLTRKIPYCNLGARLLYTKVVAY